MRIALTLTMLLVLAVTAFADTGRRGRWRVTPLRHWRALDGNHVRNPGWDTTYYSPYTPTNTITSGTPTPIAEPVPLTGQWQTDGNIPNTIPQTPWTGGTPTQTFPPASTANPITSPTTRKTLPTDAQYIPSTQGTRTQGIQSSRPYRPTTTTIVPSQSPAANYWNSLGN